MSIVSSDLIPYAAASMPADDASTSGGAVDQLRRVTFTQISSAGTVKVSSSNAGDTTQTATITGRIADGTLTNETINVNGTTGTSTAATFERILKVELSASCAGTVTVLNNTGAVTLGTIPVGERGFMAIFRQLASDPSNPKDFYCKFFWFNKNGTLALTSSAVLQNADPSGKITHALDATIGASTSVANRVTSPGFTFDDTSKSVPNSGSLSANTGIGVWLHLALSAGDAALKTSYTSEIDGQTT